MMNRDIRISLKQQAFSIRACDNGYIIPKDTAIGYVDLGNDCKAPKEYEDYLTYIRTSCAEHIDAEYFTHDVVAPDICTAIRTVAQCLDVYDSKVNGVSLYEFIDNYGTDKDKKQYKIDNAVFGRGSVEFSSRSNDTDNTGTDTSSCDSDSLSGASTNTLIAELLSRMLCKQNIKVDVTGLAAVSSKLEDIALSQLETNETLSNILKQLSDTEDHDKSADDTDYELLDSKSVSAKHIIGYEAVKAEITRRLNSRKAIILSGVPGTAKTTIVRKYLSDLFGSDDAEYRKHVEFIAFHQDYSNSDFVGGYRADKSGKFTYRDGVLAEIANRAINDKDGKYYLVIDEISRGYPEAIFGEALTAIESRGMRVKTLNGSIIIPDNLYIIGTMNIRDNSTKTVDNAFAQRFSTMEIMPQWNDELYHTITDDAKPDVNRKAVKSFIDAVSKINCDIIKDCSLGRTFVIGQRQLFYLGDKTKDEFKDAMGRVFNDIKETVHSSLSNTVYDDMLKPLEKALEEV